MILFQSVIQINQWTVFFEHLFIMSLIFLLQVGGTTGKLKTFIVTPFIPHKQVPTSRDCINFQISMANLLLYSSFMRSFYSILNFQEEESYICIYSGRDEDCILFYHAGGIDIGNVEEKAQLIKIPTEGSEISTTNQSISDEKMMNLLKHLNPSKIE